MIAAKQLDTEMLEKALAGMDFSWLRDQRGVYRIEMAASDEYGGIRTRYEFSLEGEANDVLIMRLRSLDFFDGVSDELIRACNDWNLQNMLPKAGLYIDRDADSALLLEHVLPFWEEPITQELVDCSVEFFRRVCTEFLTENAEALLRAPRFDANNIGHTVH
jgi:hypothetical protein